MFLFGIATDPDCFTVQKTFFPFSRSQQSFFGDQSNNIQKLPSLNRSARRFSDF